MSIDWTQVIIGICSIVITGVIVPLLNNLRKEIKNKLTASEQQTIEYWTEAAVRWAKQWLQSESGETKKVEVMYYLTGKIKNLGLSVNTEDLDKLVESIYQQVKTESTSRMGEMNANNAEG